MSDEDSVLPYRIKIVLCNLNCCISVASVMIIPVFGSHKDRNSKSDACHSRSNGNITFYLRIRLSKNFK